MLRVLHIREYELLDSIREKTNRKCFIVREAQLSFHIPRLELKIIDWMALKELNGKLHWLFDKCAKVFLFTSSTLNNNTGIAMKTENHEREKNNSKMMCLLKKKKNLS